MQVKIDISQGRITPIGTLWLEMSPLPTSGPSPNSARRETVMGWLLQFSMAGLHGWGRFRFRCRLVELGLKAKAK